MPVGTYTVIASFLGLKRQAVENVGVQATQTATLDFALAEEHMVFECGLLVCRFTPPIISTSPFASRVIVGDGIDPPNGRGFCRCPDRSMIYPGG